MRYEANTFYASSVQLVDRQATSAAFWVETADGSRSSAFVLLGPARTPRFRPPTPQCASSLRWQRDIPGSFTHEVRLPLVCQQLGRLISEQLRASKERGLCTEKIVLKRFLKSFLASCSTHEEETLTEANCAHCARLLLCNCTQVPPRNALDTNARWKM